MRLGALALAQACGAQTTSRWMGTVPALRSVSRPLAVVPGTALKTRKMGPQPPFEVWPPLLAAEIQLVPSWVVLSNTIWPISKTLPGLEDWALTLASETPDSGTSMARITAARATGQRHDDAAVEVGGAGLDLQVVAQRQQALVGQQQGSSGRGARLQGAGREQRLALAVAGERDQKPRIGGEEGDRGHQSGQCEGDAEDPAGPPPAGIFALPGDRGHAHRATAPPARRWSAALQKSLTTTAASSKAGARMKQIRPSGDCSIAKR